MNQSASIRTLCKEREVNYVIEISALEWIRGYFEASDALLLGRTTYEIRRLKEQPGGDIRILGSATLVQSLMGTDLIGEYWLLVHPLILGKGKRIFNGGMKTNSLKLIEAKAFGSGVVLLR